MKIANVSIESVVFVLDEKIIVVKPKGTKTQSCTWKLKSILLSGFTAKQLLHLYFRILL